ncbi:unnamed protein product [Rhizophagus irregularis]|uniref:DUF659 domain-containing protein n=1 Tax=Rhizophagus irregularis TaxID=588596 RepID=A0A915YP38_9GLOM|nr:unnamed protein product [Rhizophagus irregularis]CAB5303123.1 unnamed protein product [Rhizophagus irregularis]
MPPLPAILNDYIIKTKEKLNQKNLELLGKRKSIQDVPSYQSYGTASTTSSLPDSSGRKLPDRRSLGGEILKDAVAEGDKVMEIALKEDQTGVTLTFDGWTNVRNEQLLGVVIMTSEGRPYVWKAVDISLERETHVEVMEKTEAMISDLKSKGVNVCAVVTDSASAYAAARRRLRISNRAIVFLPCFAHQINLCKS